jgi:hypothetical protein
MTLADTSLDDSYTESASSKRYHRTAAKWLIEATPIIFWLLFVTLAIAPAAAQSDVGDVYCDTGVETGIDLVFSAVAGLGLPATMFYTGKSGLAYMRAGGNPERKNAAKEKLVMSGIGFAIVVLALIAPEIIDKVGSQIGFTFSDCVKPF